MEKAPELAIKLLEIQAWESRGDYTARNRMVYEAIALAMQCKFPAGVRIDEKEPEWPVGFIELPEVGQLSWHLPQYETEWDGHTTEEKQVRMLKWIAYTLK